MNLHGTTIADTYAEAFRMRCARVVITARDEHWAETAARVFTGYGTSIIGCDAEAGVESVLAEAETPDGRPGRAALLFGCRCPIPDADVRRTRSRSRIGSPNRDLGIGIVIRHRLLPLQILSRFCKYVHALHREGALGPAKPYQIS
mgnify:CR=1 FL=1